MKVYVLVCDSSSAVAAGFLLSKYQLTEKHEPASKASSRFS